MRGRLSIGSVREIYAAQAITSGLARSACRMCIAPASCVPTTACSKRSHHNRTVHCEYTPAIYKQDKHIKNDLTTAHMATQTIPIMRVVAIQLSWNPTSETTRQRSFTIPWQTCLQACCTRLAMSDSTTPFSRPHQHQNLELFGTSRRQVARAAPCTAGDSGGRLNIT
eukprot:5183783-Amphidinium_carterae.1